MRVNMNRQIKQLSGEVGAAEKKLQTMKEKGMGNARAIQAQENRVRKLKGTEGIKGTYTARVRVLSCIQKESKISLVWITELVALVVAWSQSTPKKQFLSIAKEQALRRGDKPNTGGDEDGGSSAADKLKRQLEAGKALSREFEQQKQLLMAKNVLQEQILQNEFDRLNTIEKIRTTAAASQQADLVKAANEVAALERAKLIAQYGEEQLVTAQELINQTALQIEADARREELIAQGVNPALAESLVQIEQQFDAERKQLDALEGILTAELARVDK